MVENTAMCISRGMTIMQQNLNARGIFQYEANDNRGLCMRKNEEQLEWVLEKSNTFSFHSTKNLFACVVPDSPSTNCCFRPKSRLSVQNISFQAEEP